MTATSLKIPRPTTTTALLASEGFARPRVTVHRYVESRECEVRGEPAWEFIFQCEETDERRRWGLVKRTPLQTIPMAPSDPDAGDTGAN